MAGTRATHTWRVSRPIRWLAAAVPLLLLPVAIWPGWFDPTWRVDLRSSQAVFLVVVYVVLAAIAWHVFRCRITVRAGTVRVTNAWTSRAFPADEVVAVEPTARGIRFVLADDTTVIAYAVPCPRPEPGQRPRWMAVAEAVAGDDPARVAIIRRGRPGGPAMRGPTAQLTPTAYRLTGRGEESDVTVCQQTLRVIRPRLGRAFVTLGAMDDWPPELRTRVSSYIEARLDHSGAGRTRRRFLRDARLPDLTLDLRLDADVDLVVALTPFVASLEVWTVDGSTAGVISDRCRAAQFTLTDEEHLDLLGAVADEGIDPKILVQDLATARLLAPRRVRHRLDLPRGGG